jgi:thiamine pyrophosphokinase
VRVPREKEPDRLIAAVFLDGEYGDPAWHRALAARVDILLAADGGAAFLAGLGIAPQAVVGDFDSLDGGVAEALQAAGVELLRHPAHKDVTDGELAVEEALRRGAAEVLLAGGTGALDHTLGHLAILRRLEARGVAARLVAPDLAVAVLTAPADVTLAAPTGVRVSLAPAGADATVSLAGLEYPLDHGVLPADACVGLGNHVTAPGGARIVVHAGSVVALVEWAGEPFAGAVGVGVG